MNQHIQIHNAKGATMLKGGAFLFFLLATVSLPVWAGMYKCQAGGKTIYQDMPCPNAKVVNNSNGQTPTQDDQMRAMERAAKERSSATQLENDRKAEQLRTTNPATTTTIQVPSRPSTVESKPKKPDRYYDRPDRYYDRPDKYYSRPDRNKKPITSQSVDGGQMEHSEGVTNSSVPNQTQNGNSIDSANGDFEVRAKAKADYQKQKIPGFITHQPTDPHELDVYKQEMNRQKNTDPNNWYR
jgi:hypothetical protein